VLSRTFAVLYRIALTVPITVTLAGQESQEQHRALKLFLGLGDAESVRLSQKRPDAAVALTDSQRRKLEEVAEVLSKAWVYQAVNFGLIPEELWPGQTLCYDEISGQGLGLTGAQTGELQRLRSQPRAARLAVLTKSQLARLASFEAQLQLLNQAIDLGLLKRPAASERLCH
jgi:hypothetical protein